MIKFERIIWGVLLLFVGGVLLLDNLNVIQFYWSNVWQFWPVFLIVLGIKMLLNRNGSQLGSKIALGVTVLALGFIFVGGQEQPMGGNKWMWSDRDMSIDWDDDNKYEGLEFLEPYTVVDSSKKTILNLSGGGTSFKLDEDITDNLFYAIVNRKKGNFSLVKTTTDTTNTLTFTMKGKSKSGKSGWSFNTGGNEVDIRLHTQPLWEMNLNMGAGALDFDLSAHKVSVLNFDGGAADVKIKMGELLPIANLNIKTGVANVEIKVPETAGCKIKTRTGLSAKDFKGFVKVEEGLFETSNYQASKNKIHVNLDGGLSNFEVDRY